MASAPWNTDTLARWPGVTIPIDDCDGRYTYDTEAADRAAEFFPLFLTHHKGTEFAGRPFELLDWQRDLIVRPLFGWKRTRDGLRRFRKLLLFVPKKQGKTELVAGLANLVLFCDGEPGAEIIIAAADLLQANLLFAEASAMVEDSPDLVGRADVLRREIVYRDTRSSMKVITAEARTKHGPNLHCVIIDELHAQPDRDLVETLEKGVAARLQPLIMYLSTAGEDQESIAYEEYTYAKKLIHGAITDERCLPVIFEADPKADWRDIETARRANPSFGITVPEEYYADQIVQAINEPRKQNAYKRLHLNLWTQQQTAWIPLEWWDACRVPRSVGDEPALPLVGQGVFDAQVCGLDLSSTEDLTAFVVVRRIPNAAAAPIVVDLGPGGDDAPAGDRPGRDGEARPLTTINVDFDIEVLPYFWLPEDTLHDRAKNDNVPYPLWRDMGLLRVTPGSVVDYDRMHHDIVDEIVPTLGLVLDARGDSAPTDIEQHRGTTVAFDPWQANQFSASLRKSGFFILGVRQGMQSLSAPTKVLAAMIKSKRVRHDGHLVLRWNVGNASVKEDRNGNILPTKSHRKQRIDGLAAIIDALSRLNVMPQPKPRSSRAGRAIVMRADGIYDAITGEQMSPASPGVRL